MIIKTGPEEALRAARYFGAENFANERRTVMNSDDRLNLAAYYGVDSWTNIPEDFRMKLLEEYQEGVRREKQYHTR